MKQQLETDSTTDSLSITVWDHNRKEIPSVATIDIYDGSTQLVSGASATIATDGTCSYTPGTTVTDDYEENLKAAWNLTIDGGVQKHIQLFDVVNFKLYPQITDEDLISECSQLQDGRYLHYGTADSGTTTTLVDIELMEYKDDHWKGGTLEIVDGTNSGSKEVVSAFDRTTGTVTVSSAFGSAIDSTSKYVVRRTFQREIDRAWDDMMAMVLQKGYRPALIMNSEELTPSHIAFALSKVCRDLSIQQDDVWWARAEFYEERFNVLWNAMVFKYDSDEDQLADDERYGILRFRR